MLLTVWNARSPFSSAQSLPVFLLRKAAIFLVVSEMCRHVLAQVVPSCAAGCAKHALTLVHPFCVAHPCRVDILFDESARSRLCSGKVWCWARPRAPTALRDISVPRTLPTCLGLTLQTQQVRIVFNHTTTNLHTYLSFCGNFRHCQWQGLFILSQPSQQARHCT